MSLANFDRLVWLFIVGLAVIGGGLALYGWSLEDSTRGNVWHIIYRALLFFKLDKHVGEYAEDNWALDIAQVLAPLATYTVIIRVGIQLFTTELSRWITRGKSNHTVICGLGEQGSTFAEHARKLDKKATVIAIEVAPNDGHISFCRLHGIRLVRGDCRDRQVLRAAAVQRAASIIVATPNDNKNLETVIAVRDLVGEQVNRIDDIKAYVAIRDWDLWSELTHSDAIKRSAPHFELRPFCLPVLAARKFFWDEPIYSYADMRGQQRIHAVFVGFDDYAATLLAQMLRCCNYKTLKRTAATILVSDPTGAERKFLRCYPEVGVDYPEIGPVSDLRFVAYDRVRQSLEFDAMADIEKTGGVTAVFVCQDTDDNALSTAVSVNDAMRRHGLWKAPIYVRMNSGVGGTEILVPPEDAYRFHDVIAPFGTKHDLCDTVLIGRELEAVAQNIHNTYRATRNLRYDTNKSREREESAQDWRQLRETYRQSNRRAADHIKAKLASAGCYVPAGFRLAAPDSLRICDSETLVEALSELEHESWCAGMRIDGWRPGQRRDNMRKIHDNLVPYAKLDESTKDYDRDQVRILDGAVIARLSAPGGDMSLVRRDHWIGLIGRNGITTDEAGWLDREMVTRVLPRLVERFKDSCFTLVTPLAPGSDYVLTDSAVRFFQAQKLAHRLLVVEGVPDRHMIDDFRETWQGGATWNGQPKGPQPVWDDPDSPSKAMRVAIAAGRLALFRKAADRLGPRGNWFIDFTEPGADYNDSAVRQSGYQRAADYVAARCATLIAACDPEAAVKPGGTNETLARRATLATAASAAGWPVTVSPTTIKLDLRQRAVHGN